MIDPPLTQLRSRSPVAPWIVCFALLPIAIAYLHWQGRVWWCQCGGWNPISLDINSEHNSQHFLDPYSFTHVLHGFIFAGLFWFTRKRMSLPWQFTFAMAIEIIWEMAENSPFIIDRYRTATISLGYTGDSIANSIGDIASAAAGFWIASRLGLWKSVAVFIAVELLLLFWIRDNLALNVIMLIHPIDAIRHWQSGM